MGLTLSLIEYDPWGQPTGGALPSPFGFTGEYQNGGLVYLRARWYQPGNGRFMVHDPMSGRDRAPKTFHPYQYAWNAPTVHTDPTGWTPPAHHRPFGVAIKGESDCPTWHGTMRALCEEGDLEDATATPEELENALWARLQVDMNVVTFGYARGLGPGTGWQEAADMMAYFLYGGGVHQDIYPDDDFSQDQGVLRGTRGINPADFVEHSAEANLVFPLVHDLIRNHMKASWTDKSSPPVPVTIEALNGVHYKDTNRGAFGKGELPGSYRAHDRGFYSADGRFVMTGEFKYNAMFCADDGGYYMSYGARYSINEPYDWHDGTVTDFGLMKIPHSWHNSLVKAGLANEYDYTVHWSDHQTLFITTDRSQFREASPLMGHLLDELQLTNWANTR
ncbi:MAG TPA: RHS repeat-associated core domain-containing protein [Herpetosiphonaceae bacterium]|nr:RHS repeat-associated core domain-containing protein [Herpetosiphonaceae bacterium]